MRGAAEHTLKCNVCWNDLCEWTAVTRCNHVFCIPCAQRHFARVRSCPKCGLAVASEDEVRTVDLSVPPSLFGASPLQALAAARETCELWAAQGRAQDERRRDKCAAELAEARAALAAEREDSRQLRAAKARLAELVETLRRSAPEAGPVRDAGLTPLARVVASPGGARPPELFRAAAPSPAPIAVAPDNVFSRFRVAASPGPGAPAPGPASGISRPNSLMEGPGGSVAGRPVTPALQILHTRRYY